jgi:hypothetical protein
MLQVTSYRVQVTGSIAIHLLAQTLFVTVYWLTSKLILHAATGIR